MDFKKIKQAILVIIVAVLLIYACKKGDTGAVGQAGATDVQEVAAGSSGSVILVGTTAPIATIKIDTFTVQTKDWVDNSVYYVGTGENVNGYFSKYFDRSDTALTGSFLNGKDIVTVYFQSEQQYNSNIWSPIPFTSTTSFGYNINYAYEILAGKLRFHFYLNKVTTDPPSVQSYIISKARFKIVFATGNIVNSLRTAHINKDIFKGQMYQRSHLL